MNRTNETHRPIRPRMSEVAKSFRSSKGLDPNLLHWYEYEREQAFAGAEVIDLTDAKVAAEAAANLDQELADMNVDVVTTSLGRMAFVSTANVEVSASGSAPLPPTVNETPTFEDLLGDVESDDFFQSPPYIPVGENFARRRNSEPDIKQFQQELNTIQAEYEQRIQSRNVDEASVVVNSRRKKGKLRNWVKDKYYGYRARKYNYEAQPRGLKIATVLASVALAGIAFVSINADNATSTEKITPTWTPPTEQVRNNVQISTAASVPRAQFDLMTTPEFAQMVNNPETFADFLAWAEAQPAGTDIQALLDNLQA